MLVSLWAVPPLMGQLLGHWRAQLRAEQVGWVGAPRWWALLLLPLQAT